MRHGVLTACLMLAACGGGSAPQPAQAAPPPAELRVGELRIIASAVETSALPESVTKRYGIARGEETWLLLVTVRRGPEGAETAVSSTVEARARDLQGRTIDIPMREIQTADDYVDNVGTFSITPPDTLQFSVRVMPQGAAPATLEFTREIAR
jgi:hypothetical protein